MKASIPLLIALGITSQPVWAQAQNIPPPTPPSGIEVHPEPSASQPSATEMQPPGVDPSSGGGMTPSTGSGAADTPAENQGGAVPDPSSGGSNAMQSEAGMELRAAAPPVFELKPVVQGDVTYLCGGVGEEETAFMKREAKDYDLMLTFATRSGDFLADVDVDIADASGNSVLQTTCDGPIMLVDLPKSGNYRVHAETAGYKLNQTVKVATAKQGRPSVASASLVWPQRVAEAPAAASTATGGSATGSGAAGDSGTKKGGAR